MIECLGYNHTNASVLKKHLITMLLRWPHTQAQCAPLDTYLAQRESSLVHPLRHVRDTSCSHIFDANRFH